MTILSSILALPVISVAAFAWYMALERNCFISIHGSFRCLYNRVCIQDYGRAERYTLTSDWLTSNSRERPEAEMTFDNSQDSDGLGSVSHL